MSTPVNDAPVVIDPASGLPAVDADAVVAAQSSDDGEAIAPLDVGVLFADPDTTDVLAFTATGLPAGLAIDPVTGVISGTVDPAASVDGPYTVTVTATDPHGATATTSFDWAVGNPPPVAIDDAIAATEDDLTVSGDVLADNGGGGDHDTAPDSDDLTVSAINGVAGDVGQPVDGSDGGSFTIGADGVLAFDPAGDFDDLAAGETRTTTVTYTITDGQGGTDTATVTITVSGVNDAPASTEDLVATDEDMPKVLSVSDFGDYSDIEGKAIDAVRITALPANGELEYFDGVAWMTVTPGQVISAADIAAGSLRFIPAANELGAPYASIGFQVFDGSEFSVTPNRLDIVVTPVNDDPIGDDIAITTKQEVPISGRVLASDIDSETLTVLGPVAGPSHGLVVVNPDGTFTYAPQFGFSGDDSFVVRVSDGNGGTDDVTVSVVVTSVASVPLAVELPILRGPLPPVAAPQSIVIDGIILETVDTIDVLGDRGIGIDVPGIVINTVNSIGRLEWFHSLSSGHGWSVAPILRMVDLGRLVERGASVFPQANGFWDVRSFTGYSLRMTVDAVDDTASDAGQIVVETLMRDRTILVEISDTLASDGGPQVDSYSVLQADGRPLPSWAQAADAGLLLMEVPVDGGVLDLLITAHLADGSVITRAVTLQLSSGEVQSREYNDPVVPMFEDQVRQRQVN